MIDSSSVPTRLTRLHVIIWITVSVAFGLVSIVPAITMRLDPSAGFQGIEMHAGDAEYHYAARVREVQDGFPWVSNVYYVGHKDQPYLQPPLPEWIVAGLGALFGLDAARALILSQLVFGAAVCAMMIGCLRAFTGRTWWSLAGVPVALFAGFLIGDPRQIMSFVRGDVGSWDVLSFARPINPQISGTLFYAACWALLVWRRTASRYALMLSWALTALTVYSYVYAWTLLVLFAAVLGVGDLIKRSWTRVRSLLYWAAGFALVSVPYVLNVWHASQHPFYAETAKRLGLIATHRPMGGVLLLVIFLLAILFRRRLGIGAWPVTAFGVAALLAHNQQVITGQAIVVSHYHWYFVRPVTLALAVVLIGSWVFDRWGRRLLRSLPMSIVAIPALIVIVGIGTLNQVRSVRAALPLWRTQQQAAGALGYLSTHTQAGDVTYASGFVRNLISVYTSGDVYWAINAYAYLSSDMQARDAYFFDLWIQGVTPEETAATFPTTRRAELSSRIHAIYEREAHGGYDRLSDAEVADAIQAYDVFYRQSPDEILLRYPLRFVLIAQTDPPSAAWDAIRTRSMAVYADETFEIRELFLGETRGM